MRVLRLFVRIPLSHGTDGSVDQSTDGVCSSNLPAPFHASQYPNGGVLWEEYGSERLSPDRITPSFSGGNVTRAAPLQTEPTHILQWKCAIRLQA